MINKYEMMRTAYKQPREQRRNSPRLYAGRMYTYVFALCLRGVWRDVRSGELQMPFPESQKKAIRGELIRLQMKTRLSGFDYARFSKLHQELGAI